MMNGLFKSNNLIDTIFERVGRGECFLWRGKLYKKINDAFGEEISSSRIVGFGKGVIVTASYSKVGDK